MYCYIDSNERDGRKLHNQSALTEDFRKGIQVVELVCTLQCH